MRAPQAVIHAVLHSFNMHSCRTPVLAGAICVALSVSGCASLNIFKAKEAPAPAPANAAASPAADAKAGSAVATDGSGAKTTTVTGLQKFLWVFSPYRPDVQQGNFISQEMLAQLKEGMTRDQVRFVLGTPLVTDLFHADRWDYPFRLERGNGELTTSRVSVYFKDDKLARFDGGNLPTEKEYIARIAGPVKIVPGKMPIKEEPRAAPNAPSAPSAPSAPNAPNAPN
jgi:outer membrane protein assembly factor BamE